MSIKKGLTTIASSVPTTTWGSIEGTLTDQTDLNNYLNSKASNFSPVFTGTPTAPTAAAGSSNSQIATTSFVSTAVSGVFPTQSGQNGKFLTTNGTTTSWASVEALPSQSGNSGKFLKTNGTTASWSKALENAATYEASIIVNSTTTNKDRAIIMGLYSEGYDDSVTIGYNAKTSGQYAVGIGQGSGGSGDFGVAVGQGAKANAKGAIQLGGGTNSTEGTLSVCLYQSGINFTNYQLLQKDGTIPSDRLASGGSNNNVLIKTSSGQSWGSVPSDSTKAGLSSNNTFTGTNTFNNYIKGKSTTIDSTLSSRSSSEYQTSVALFDKNDVRTAVIENEYTTDGSTKLHIKVNKTADNQAGMTICMNNAGDTVIFDAHSGIKQSITKWGFPDYTSGVSRTNTSYTADTNGFIYAHCVRGASSYGTLNIIIGSKTFAITSNDYADEYVLFPVTKGTSYSFNWSNLTSVDITWFPAIGG